MCTSFPTRVAIDGSIYEVLDELDGMDFLPALSPDGSILAYDGGVLLNLKTKSKVVIDPSIYGIQVEPSENTESNQMVSPIWSPNGKYIAWLAHTNQNGEYGIFILDSETPSGRMVIQYVPYFITLSRAPWQVWDTSTIQWSPDSSKLLVTTQVSNRLSSEFNGVEGTDRSILWVVTADGTVARRIGIGDHNYEPGVWSPDSMQIAFVRFEVDSGEVNSYLLHVDDWTVTQLPIPQSNFPIAWVEIK
jgi:Tol biopolymer transport system component